MIPATYPSILDSSNRTKMLVYQVPSITGLTRWVDYIPVKSPASESDLTLANTYANEGFILTSKVNDITGLVPFKDYVPIYLDSTATKAWSADNDGYIPMAELAGLLLDFTTGSLDARINFSRTTNATVTNSAGVITYAPHNLLTYSEQFDNAAWTKNTASILSNVTASPINTITADKLYPSATTSSINSGGTTGQTSGVYFTSSIYVKAAEKSFAYLQINGLGGTTTASFVTINLSTGVAGTVQALAGGGLVNTSVLSENIGNGWYRLKFTYQLGVGNTQVVYYIGVSDSQDSRTVAVNSTDGIYIWGAQLEIDSTATTYNSTTVKNLLGYSELFDNAAWTKSNSFVQTNLLTYSEAFDNAAWSKGNATVTANNVIAPNGYQTAEYLESTIAAQTYFRQTSTVTNSTAYTQSIYAKKGTVNWLKMEMGWAGFKFANFNLNTGVVGTLSADVTATIIDVGNGWYRCIATASSTSTSGFTQFNVTSAENTNPTASGQGIYIWGAQLVQGSVAGDYRRTDAAALPVYYANHNGVVCAEKLVEDAASARHRLILASGVLAVLNGSYTFSIYLKEAERRYAFQTITDSVNVYSIVVDLRTATITSNSGAGTLTNITTSATSVGNGWVRVRTTANVAGTSLTTQYGISDSATPTYAGSVPTYTGDGTSGLYIFGAQLSDSASLDPYVLNAAAAPTAAAYYGARFDYDPVTLAPKGLLIEEQRVNYCLWSEDFSQATWSKTTTTVTSNSEIAPSGLQAADTLTATGANAITKQAITTTAIAFTFSVYLKRKTGTGNIDISMDGTTFVTQTINSSAWTRCIVTQTGVAGTSNPSIRIATNGDEVYAWGAQVE